MLILFMRNVAKSSFGNKNDTKWGWMPRDFSVILLCHTFAVLSVSGPAFADLLPSCLIIIQTEQRVMDRSDCLILFSALSLRLWIEVCSPLRSWCTSHLSTCRSGDHCATVLYYCHVLIAWPSTFCLAVWMDDLCPTSLSAFFPPLILTCGSGIGHN